MNLRFFSLILVAGLASLSLSACGGSDSGDAMSAAQSGMPAMNENSAVTATHAADGTLNSIDRDASTVNIAHGPVTSADWPAMTMSFKLANPNSTPVLEPGQRIRFEFTIESGMSATVTRISAIE
jgi:Cu/Ag efflux protein CusF